MSTYLNSGSTLEIHIELLGIRPRSSCEQGPTWENVRPELSTNGQSELHVVVRRGEILTKRRRNFEFSMASITDPLIKADEARNLDNQGGTQVKLVDF